MNANGKLRVMFISGGQSSQPGVVRDVSSLAFNELAEEGKFLVIGHDVRGTANFPLGDEHLQMGHDFVFELLIWRGDERVRSKQMGNGRMTDFVFLEEGVEVGEGGGQREGWIGD